MELDTTIGDLRPAPAARARRSPKRSLARAFAVTVIVVAAACGSESPTSTGGGGTNKLSGPACGPSSVLTLGTNQASTLACSSGTFINLAGGAKYLIVPQFASGGLDSNIADFPVAYQIGVPATATTALAQLAVRPSVSSSAGPAAVDRHARQHAFDAMLRDRARKAVRTQRWHPIRSASGVSADLRPGVSAAVVPAVGSLRTFHALSGPNENSVTTTARLSYVGSNVLLYIDTLAPANGFTAGQLQSFGQYFDQTLYQLDVSNFGPPSDVDQNGHVIMLMSQTVNSLTTQSECKTEGYVAGYFDAIDLTTDPNSNQGEIFYSVVPDSLGTVSCAHTVANLLLDVPATFLHELQHLISFGQHAIVHGGEPEEGWLDEGMSIRAEEFGSQYYEAKFPPPSGRSDPSQLFPDSSQGFIAGFLPDSYAYLLRPDTASLTLHDDSQNGFSWRGGDWLLVHWLGDQKGKSIYAAMEQSNLTGIPNIVTAFGEPFGPLFGDFSLTMWTDSLVGVPRSAIPTADRMQTRNLRQLYQRLFVTSPNDPAIPRAYPVLPVTLTTTGGPLTASMAPGTMSFYILDLTGSSSNVAIQFSAPGGTAFPSRLNPQVSVYHLPN